MRFVRNILFPWVASVLFGGVSGAFAAGSYVENFESVSALTWSGNQSSSLANGAELWGSGNSGINGSFATAISIHSNNSPSWKALSLSRSGSGYTTATYVVGTVENPSTRVNSFTASFDLLLANAVGANGERFSFNFGNLTGTLPRDGESGLWSSGQTGSMLSLVWDYAFSGSGDFVGTGANGGVQLFRNGLLVSGSNVNNPITIPSNWNGSFTRVNIRYDELLNGGTFTFNTGGTVGANNLISGGSNFLTLANLGVNFAAGDKFAISALSSGIDVDTFIDNVSIQTVPEPSALSLLAIGLGGLAMLRRRRS
jgi:hypothetical protein